MTDSVTYTQRNGIGWVEVNRPDKRHAMDVPTRKHLRATIADAVDDDDANVLIVGSKGTNSYLSGGDINELKDKSSIEMLNYTESYGQGLYNFIAEVPKPTIAAIDGYALGGGLEVAMACDIRLATRGIKLGLPETTLGVLPGGGGTQRLCTLVGVGRAKELIFTGNLIDADDAAAIGLVNHVYDEDEFDDAVDELASDIVSNAPLALRLAKKAIHHGVNIDSGLEYEQLAGSILFGTADQREGMGAFLESREPNYRGE